MKKILLSLSVFASLTLSAQTTVFSASDSLEFAQMTFVDSDADGFNWRIVNWTGVAVSFASQGSTLTSASYDNPTETALTPDNWAITPALNFTGLNAASLSFGRVSVDPNYPAENYSVYAVTAASPTEAVLAFASATPIFNETVAVGGQFQTKTVDLSAFNGLSNVYVAFRHHNVTDMFVLVLDDIRITGTPFAASIQDLSGIVNKVYPNPASDVLNIEALEEISFVEIFTLDGKILKSQEVNANNATIDVVNFETGVYTYKVMTKKGNVIVNTFVKK
jgi:hypothetical protein